MLPTSLYIHIPWCIQKCPYCDFNSHKSPDILPETRYIDALLVDFKQDLSMHQANELTSVFFGGGTPSLFSGQAYAYLLEQLQTLIPFAPTIEITLEANPGTVEQQRFTDYRQAGINRLSLGIQSFNKSHLQALGRIHDDQQAHRAIEAARNAGFDNINLDVMHGLPNQTVQEGLADLHQALAYQPEHLSWYQLTLEPNTVFYKKQPPLPAEETLEALESEGFALLQAHQFHRYEISAFCQPGRASQHNLNYWLFGDYYGIGAGAHGKLTGAKQQPIFRTRKHRLPRDYLDEKKLFLADKITLDEAALIFEYMLNTTRLEQVIPYALFEERTGLAPALLQGLLQQAAALQLISLQPTGWQVTALGRRYTDNLQALFLPVQNSSK